MTTEELAKKITSHAHRRAEEILRPARRAAVETIEKNTDGLGRFGTISGVTEDLIPQNCYDHAMTTLASIIERRIVAYMVANALNPALDDEAAEDKP